MSTRKNLGPISAYALAVEGGYTGTEAEFEAYLANATAKAQETHESAEAAETSAGYANRDALVAEGYATGKQNGVDVDNTSPYFENNAKHYCQLTQAAETTAVQAINTAGTNQVNAVQNKGTQVLNSIPADYTELSGDVSDLNDTFSGWMGANDFIGNEIVKVNLLEVPYSSEDVFNGKQILSNGSISDTPNKSVSSLIPITEGTYGLKTAHNEYVGMISSGNSYKNGYGFFAADGVTVVARPTTLLHNVGTDIYVFDVPADAVYVRFCYVSSSNDYDTALGYFNQWILLPDADDNIDDSFFILDEPASNGETDKIMREDNSKVYLRDNRIGNLEGLATTNKSTIVAALNEMAESSGGNTPAEAWLIKNNLDAETGGKVNILAVPYSASDVQNGKQILSNGSIGDWGTKSVSPLIPITEGTYGLKTAHNEYVGMINDTSNYAGGYGFFAVDGTTVVARPTTLLHNVGTDIYVFDAPANAAYVRFCYISSGENYYDTALSYFNQWILLPDADDNIDNSFFTLASKKDDGEIKKILRVDGSYLEIVDEIARERAQKALSLPITFGRRTCAIFEKVCCIGDSFTAGYIYSSAGVAHSDPKYSWVKHLENMTGREYVNLGISGATSASWLTNENGLVKMLLPENKSQAYLIGLQINDAATGLAVGTVEDIGTDTVSYYGCISKIINQIFAVNNLAHVFIQTQPKNFTGAHTPYRTALLSIVDWYQTEGNGTHQTQVHLIDLLDYYKLYQGAGCNDSMANGHFTAVGWEYCAEILMYAWSNYINAHPLLFQDVNLIPFGSAT